MRAQTAKESITLTEQIRERDKETVNVRMRIRIREELAKEEEDSKKSRSVNHFNREKSSGQCCELRHYKEDSAISIPPNSRISGLY